MLRQALDDAARGERQTRNARIDIDSSSNDHFVSEAQPLISNGTYHGSTTTTYSATRNGGEVHHGESDQSSSEDEDEDAQTMEDWHSDDLSQTAEPTPTTLTRMWEAGKNFSRLFLNVENLWDSPTQNNTPPEISRRNHYIVFFWFFVLASSYAMERSTFKLIVDRSGPFRLFAVEMITFIHALMIATGMLISAFMRKDFTFHNLGIPLVDVGCK